MFEQYHYNEAIIFGHALDGNLHFVFTQNFDTSAAIEQYRTFMEEVTELVAVKYQGSLKAEHGTGRNMAPFVELEWGKDAYRLMLEIKSLFDPLNLMNPGVIINTDSNAHLKDLKPMPATHSNVDPCMECGFCEPVCPSKTLSLSPRQRIVLYRELQGQQAKGAVDPELEKLFDYQGIETCAVTGLCESRCPISINTGTLIDSLRSKSKSNPIAKWSANNFDKATQIARWGLTANQCW
ncbi:D-lactate dehydrogenase [Vibrio ishigakensis]|uniref:D-lactate dehydrogenase n=1 Tax=Vibrio ishigakensis TaxID=1481914 RepID=A0A0B8P0W4_9VIBR|nr:D-lactate dehydrogenase [Vibrio ishigakensis]